MKKIKMILGNSFKSDIRVLKEARTLVQNGYEVEVLAWDRENELLNKEYEEIDGIKIKRFFPKAKYGSGKKQIFSFIKFIFEVKKYLKNKEFDYLHCHDLDGLIVGYVIKKEKHKLIYDSHEFFAGYKNMKIDKKIYYLEKILLKKVSEIISVSESICGEMKKIYKLKKNPILLRNIPYYYPIDKKQNLLRKEFGISDEKKILLYQGVFISGRGIEEIIKLLKDLPQIFVLVLIGKGREKLKILEMIEKEKLKNRVYIKDFVSNDILLNYTNSADIGILLPPKTSLSYWYSLPNKIFEFIQGEIPICCNEFPEIKKLIEENQFGISIDINNSMEIEKKILDLLKNHKNKIERIKKFKGKFCWEKEEKKLLKLYKNLNLEERD